MPKTNPKREYQVTAMKSLLGFSKAMSRGNLAIGDLAQVMSVAIESGFDAIQIHLVMAIAALKICQKNEGKANEEK